MSSDFYRYEATIDLSKVEAWEAEAIHYFLRERRRYSYCDHEKTSFHGRFMIFEYEDCDNRLWEDPKESPRICQEVEEECLHDILRNLMAKHALSLTYLLTWSHGDGYEEDDPLSKYSCEELAERIPTLVLQEVLAKRLT